MFNKMLQGTPALGVLCAESCVEDEGATGFA